MMGNNIQREKLNSEVFKKAIQDQGYIVVENVIEDDLIFSLKVQLEESIEKESNFHGTQSFQEYGMLICCPIYGGSFLTLADHEKLMQPFDWMLGDTSIIYVYTSSSIPPKSKNYASRIHVDRPHDTGNFLESLGCLILLDDFTEENGATWVLPGSHQINEVPDNEYFYKHAIRIIAPKGSVFYFHLRIYHAGGINTTQHWRHSLGIGMIRGYMKQRIDIPRALKNVDLSSLSSYGMQKLGFYSQPPTSLKEFYLPLEKRSYKQKSEWEK